MKFKSFVFAFNIGNEILTREKKFNSMDMEKKSELSILKM